MDKEEKENKLGSYFTGLLTEVLFAISLLIAGFLIVLFVLFLNK
jgi:hypothetical protein